MVQHLFARFLEDPSEYEGAKTYWANLWNRMNELQRLRRDWRHPWLSSGVVAGIELRDGNPIFSAYNPETRYGVRVIQYPPESDHLEFDWWLDTFGGPATDPRAIRELVIACALSEEAADRAFELMQTWCRDGKIETCFERPLLLDYDLGWVSPFSALAC